jgi:hypothetical protein
MTSSSAGRGPTLYYRMLHVALCGMRSNSIPFPWLNCCLNDWPIFTQDHRGRLRRPRTQASAVSTIRNRWPQSPGIRRARTQRGPRRVTRTVSYAGRLSSAKLRHHALSGQKTVGSTIVILPLCQAPATRMAESLEPHLEHCRANVGTPKHRPRRKSVNAAKMLRPHHG